MAKANSITSSVNISNYLKFILGALIGMFVSGAAMTAIGQPTTTHALSGSGNTLWHILLVFHLMFLAIMTIGALALLKSSLSKTSVIKVRAVIGLIAILFGIVSGILVLHKVHPGVFLFCMALSFLAIGATYGPLGGGRGYKH